MQTQPPESASFEVHALTALNIVILHIFSCLNAKGVLPFSEAAQSLQETLDVLGTPSPQIKSVIELMITSLQKFAADGEQIDPSKTPPPTRLH
jgi:hypothetical protein